MCRGLCTRLIFFLFLMQPTNSLSSYHNASYALYVNDSSVNDDGKRGDVLSKRISQNVDNNNATNTCVEPGHEKNCSGYGACNNGTCQCDSLKSQENTTEYLYEYSGKFCEECPYCQGQRCKKFLPCVRLILKNTTGDNKCDINYNLVEDIQLNYNDKLCQVEDENGCMINFKYFYGDSSELYMEIEKKTVCLNGRKYIMAAWCIFLIYIFTLMTILKIL